MKRPRAGFRERSDVENQAADFAQKFAADIVELVVLAVEAVGVNVNHLEEAFGNIGGGEGPAQMRHGIELGELPFLAPVSMVLSTTPLASSAWPRK